MDGLTQNQPSPQPQQQSQPAAPMSWPQGGGNRPKGLAGTLFSRPIPGQSLTRPPKNDPWQHPPQFTDRETAINFCMDQITEPQHLSQMFSLFKMGISVEEFVRVLIFTGFATGKWTPTLAMLMYKPLMLAVIAICNRAGQTDTKVVMPHRMKDDQLGRAKMIAKLAPGKGYTPPEEPDADDNTTPNGFMQAQGAS